MSIFNEFEERFSGRFFGRYRGIVDNINDPKQMGRLQIKVPVVLGMDDTLGWALPAPPFGGSPNVGFFACPAKGDYVWVEFEEGDPERPIWTAGPWPLGAQKQSFIPKHGKGQPDATDYSVREFGNIPPSQFEGEYGKVMTLQGHDGSFLEFDGTEGANRVQLSHVSGTRFEMGSDGSLQVVSIAGIRQRSNGETNTEVGTNQYHRVGGVQEIQVDGPSDHRYCSGLTQTFGSDADGNIISSNLVQIGNSYTSTWEGSYQVTSSGLINLLANGNASIFAGSKLSLVASEVTQMVSMAVTTGQTLSAGTKIKAHSIQTYDGSFYASALDKSGFLSESLIEVSPGLLSIDSSVTIYAGIPILPAALDLPMPVVPPCGCIRVQGDGSILLGGVAAVDPVVKYNELLILLNALIDAFDTHTHVVAGVPSALPVPIMTPIIPPLTGACASTTVRVVV
jgi:hypothetical protein